MPSGVIEPTWSANPRRWERCLKQARQETHARGVFDSHKRYHAIVRKRASALFAS